MPENICYDLSELKCIEFDILLKLKNICEENKLKYYITAGTLLGAVRHQGFIPWDDDIDVVMPYNSYNKFLSMFGKEKDGYFLQTSKTDKNYPYYFARFGKVGTRVIDKELENVDMNKLVSIDIFPLDKCPRNDKLASAYFKIVELLTNCILSKVNISFVCGYTKRSAKFLFNLIRILPLAVCKALRNMTTRLVGIFCNGKRLCTVGTRHGYPRETYSSEWFCDDVQLIFEGEQFSAPIGWDKLLTNMYDNYMIPIKDMHYMHYHTKVENQ